MSGRILMVSLGLVVAYFAVYAGDGVRVFFVANMGSYESGGWTHFGLFDSVVLAIVFFLIGGLAWGTFMRYAGDGLTKVRDQGAATIAALSLVCLSLLFGISAAPFTNYGPYPWFWASKWDVLLVLALVPTVLVFHGIAVDLVEVRRRKKMAQGKVTPISRSA